MNALTATRSILYYTVNNYRLQTHPDFKHLKMIELGINTNMNSYEHAIKHLIYCICFNREIPYDWIDDNVDEHTHRLHPIESTCEGIIREFVLQDGFLKPLTYLFQQADSEIEDNGYGFVKMRILLESNKIEFVKGRYSKDDVAVILASYINKTLKDEEREQLDNLVNGL